MFTLQRYWVELHLQHFPSVRRFVLVVFPAQILLYISSISHTLKQNVQEVTSNATPALPLNIFNSIFMTLRIPSLLRSNRVINGTCRAWPRRYSLLWICEAAARLGQGELAEILGAVDGSFFFFLWLLSCLRIHFVLRYLCSSQCFFFEEYEVILVLVVLPISVGMDFLKILKCICDAKEMCTRHL